MIRVGLDLRKASPRLRRWVTIEASTRCKAPRPLRAVDLHLRQGPSGAAALRALGPATLRVHYVEVDQLEDALQRQSEMLGERLAFSPELRKETKRDLLTVAGIVDALYELAEQDDREARATARAWHASYQGSR